MYVSIQSVVRSELFETKKYQTPISVIAVGNILDDCADVFGMLSAVVTEYGTEGRNEDRVEMLDQINRCAESLTNLQTKIIEADFNT